MSAILTICDDGRILRFSHVLRSKPKHSRGRDLFNYDDLAKGICLKSLGTDMGVAKIHEESSCFY